ncbi:hypothetical protein Pla100_05790 [Neorhodopirellula pilleata]|uniref:Uncharacterized protein n=2 Tax=Neorhodopirellula pilleata TaxID=2714738 RepID=A0A5C6AV85_9BACT|nr:hypothetical protein Pla100_05790 [Neorhodopirellula pilleata]
MSVSGQTCNAEPPEMPVRCEVVPLPGQRVSLRIDGVEKTCWNFDDGSPRPFFYPVRGPQGGDLTRIGHPGAPNHDHHRSIWFAHHKVDGQDFWADDRGTQIRQKRWIAYQDGDEEAVMASQCGWYGIEGDELIEQELIVALLPLPKEEYALEIQTTFRPGQGRQQTQLDKTNFGMLAVRVAKSISAHFGQGRLTSSEGLQGEKAVFGQPARWMDYSGPVAIGQGESRQMVTAGLTFFDHPDNPCHPTHWHVRDDGWMGAACCFEAEYRLSQEQPLVLRYLIHAHASDEPHDATEVFNAFSHRQPFKIQPSEEPHVQFQVRRVIE